MTYHWWQYHQADSADAVVAITDAEAKRTSFTVPDEPGKQVPIVLEVTDDGTPPLTRYQRVVCTIR